ncbi:MAG: host specificity protein [Chloroflexi bacterium]|nr:host specificity protein [Ardenticatenaceae bacterium]MBL1127921.1 host specificity protein [Chloroflexota bacterium]NOG33991.1 host specificity protein [Chloroflexota bacterium]GIK55677.1 MAG: 4-hydroxy-2-oxo-heptane-1,7-dioate aldolase [Chloroflexota bacterium]
MFIQPNRLKQKLKAGQPVYGVISTSDDPQLAELFGLAGFDYYLLDAEHGLIDPAQAVNVIRACERVNLTPLVRLGPKDPKLVLLYLDAGMMGVMMPDLRAAVEIEMLIAAVKYPPFGKRGVGISRASAYMARSGEAPHYLAFANENTLVIPQFEDPSLLNNFEEMISRPGVDAVMIGPRDLSLNMGFPDGPEHPEVQMMIDRVIAICRQAGVAAGITAATCADAERQVTRGATMILGVAQLLILHSARAFLPGIAA